MLHLKIIYWDKTYWRKVLEELNRRKETARRASWTRPRPRPTCPTACPDKASRTKRLEKCKPEIHADPNWQKFYLFKLLNYVFLIETTVFYWVLIYLYSTSGLTSEGNNNLLFFIHFNKLCIALNYVFQLLSAISWLVNLRKINFLLMHTTFSIPYF